MADLQKFSVKESLNQMVYDKALYVGVGGDVKLDLNGSGSAIVFKNLASGQLLPLVFDRVYDTGTTATNLVALK